MKLWKVLFKITLKWDLLDDISQMAMIIFISLLLLITTNKSCECTYRTGPLVKSSLQTESIFENLFLRASFSDLWCGYCPARTQENSGSLAPQPDFKGQLIQNSTSLCNAAISCLMVQMLYTWAVKWSFCTTHKYSISYDVFWLPSWLSTRFFLICSFNLQTMTR